MNQFLSPLFQPPEQWPTVGECDVLVAGGGPGGFAAAVAAGRQGARVILVDQASSPGGVATHCNCPHIMGLSMGGRQIVGGIADQLVRRLSRQDKARMHRSRGHLEDEPVGDRELVRDVVAQVNGLRVEMSEMLAEAGVEAWFYTRLIGALRKGDRLAAAAVDRVEGPALIRAKTFVDATGDAHLAWRAGGEVRIGEADEVMTKTLLFDLDGVQDFDRASVSQRFQQLVEEGRVPLAIQDRFMGFQCIEPGKIHINYTATVGDALCSAQLTRMDRELRRQVEEGVAWFKSEFPQFKDACLAHVPEIVGVRAGRSAVGRATISQRDIDENAPVAAPVGLGIRRYGDHGTKSFAAGWRKPVSGTRPIPWGALVAKGLDNLALAGRSISCETKMITCIRYIAQSMATGQAAGTGAALAAQADGALPQVPYGQVAEVLRAEAAILS